MPIVQELDESQLQMVIHALHSTAREDEARASREGQTDRLREQFQRQALQARQLAESLERGDKAIPVCDECGAVIPDPDPEDGDSEKGLANRHHRRSCSLFDSKG